MSHLSGPTSSCSALLLIPGAGFVGSWPDASRQTPSLKVLLSKGDCRIVGDQLLSFHSDLMHTARPIIETRNKRLLDQHLRTQVQP